MSVQAKSWYSRGQMLFSSDAPQDQLMFISNNIDQVKGERWQDTLSAWKEIFECSGMVLLEDQPAVVELNVSRWCTTMKLEFWMQSLMRKRWWFRAWCMH